MPEPHGSLHRAIAELTIGTVRSTREREARDREMGYAEIEQQYQFAISGTAVPSLAWTVDPIEIDFDYPFYYAPGQRDSDLDRPQFYSGVEVTPPVAVSIVVSSWTLDPDNGAVIGCTVNVGVVGDVTLPAYAGVVHLTFQGYGGLAEPEAEDDL